MSNFFRFSKMTNPAFWKNVLIIWIWLWTVSFSFAYVSNNRAEIQQAYNIAAHLLLIKDLAKHDECAATRIAISMLDHDFRRLEFKYKRGDISTRQFRRSCKSIRLRKTEAPLRSINRLTLNPKIRRRGLKRYKLPSRTERRDLTKRDGDNEKEPDNTIPREHFVFCIIPFVLFFFSDLFLTFILPTAISFFSSLLRNETFVGHALFSLFVGHAP